MSEKFDAGLAALNWGDYAAAAVHFEAALRDTPDDLSTLSHLALAYNASSRSAEAVATQSRCVQLAPASAEARYQLAVFLRRGGWPGEARRAAEQALVLDPTMQPARQLLQQLPNAPAAGLATRPWFGSTWFTIAVLVLFWPAGLILMWRWATWNLRTKATVSGFFGLVALAGVASVNRGPSSWADNTSVVNNSSVAAAPKAAAAKHEVVYKIGAYDAGEPAWMTQAQLDSYLNWESKSIASREAPQRRVEGEIRRILRRVIGSKRVGDLVVVRGTQAARPTTGWIAMVDVYSDLSRRRAGERAIIANAAILNAGLNVTRVMVSVDLLHGDEGVSDHCLYCIQTDKGQSPEVIQEFTPPK